MPAKDELDRALARLIAGTRRVKRGVSLVEILRDIEILLSEYGNLREIAARVPRLSPEMLRQFWSVRNLCPEVMKYVTQRRLDSVDVAHRIAKLDCRDQNVVALAYLDSSLSSRDVRDVVSYKRSHPKTSVDKAIKSVKGSRNVRHYIVLLDIAQAKATENAIRSRVTRALGTEGVVSLAFDGGIMKLVLTNAGRKVLAERAREMGITKRQFMQELLE